MDIKASHKLKNKRILITAGPTWVPIDKVRVISNIATGETGILLAERLQNLGAKVTLLLGPVGACCLDKEIRLLRFKFFAELNDVVNEELRIRKYDWIIHSAAVSDFRPKSYFRGKLASDKVQNLKLVTLPKIIRGIRRLASGAKLVMFKLESGVSDATLLQRARAAQVEAGTEVVVANRINPYQAFIINRKGTIITVKSKSELAKKLLKILTTNSTNSTA